MAVSRRHLHHHLIQHHLPRNHLGHLLCRFPAEGALIIAAKSVDLKNQKTSEFVLETLKQQMKNSEKANRVSYMAIFTETHRVHASSYNLHNFLWERHQRRLLPLKDVLALTQLSNVPLTKNENLACLLAITPVGNYQEIKIISILIMQKANILVINYNLPFTFLGFLSPSSTVAVFRLVVFLPGMMVAPI